MRRDKRSLALLAALYIAQILLSGWLHADLDVGVCKQCRDQTGPTLSAACDANGPCSLPSHHHHPRQHRDDHIGCSMCSPVASLPVEKPCFLTPAQATFRARREIESSQLEPRVLGQQCPRGPPSVPSEI